jgi:hypothetical protein
MSRALPNIMLVLSKNPDVPSPSLEQSSYHGRSCFAGDSWATNLVSLLASSLPSHHQVWTSGGKIGIHVDLLPIALKKAGYHAIFIGPRDAESLAVQCGFDDIVMLQGSDGADEARTFIDRDVATPLLITCVIPAWSTRWHDLISKHGSQTARHDLFLSTQLVPTSRQNKVSAANLEAISAPFSLSLPGIRKHVNGTAHLWSIIDLAPSLLQLLGIKVPCTMVGKDLHQYWLGKARKAIPFPRDRCLVEHADGSKTMYNASHALTVHPGKKTGEIFDLDRDPGMARNLWNEPSCTPIKSRLLLEFLWAQLDKECMPMPRIAGA